MLSRHRISNIRRLLQFLFICIFACGLCIKYFPSWSRIVSEVISVKAVVQNEYTQNFLTPPTDVNQLLKRGEKRYEAEDFQGAIADWQTALNLSNENQKTSSKIAIVEKLARAYQKIGKPKAAIAYWGELVAYYRQINNWPNVGQILIQQAQAYNSLGEFNDARRLSEVALQIARTHHDDTLESAALRIRGEAHRIEGNYNKAIIDLKFSIKAAQDTHNLAYQAAAFTQLGITYINLSKQNYNYAKIAWDTGENDEAEAFIKQASRYDFQALESFQNSLNIFRKSKDKINEIKLLIYSIPPANRIGKSQLAIAKLQLVFLLLEHLPISEAKAYAAIELAELLKDFSSERNLFFAKCPTNYRESQAINLLNQAVLIAQKLSDHRALSFAFGNLGHIYECHHDYEQALKLTKQAQQAAQTKPNAQDSLYLWYWQAGRILKSQNRPLEAIAAYEQAVTTLEKIYTQIVVTNPDLQSDPYNTLEYIYHELIALKLSLEDVDGESSSLYSAITSLDALKLAQLQNYFHKDDVAVKFHQATDLLSANTITAVFWSIVLEDRTAIVVYLPNGETKLKWINFDSQRFKDEITKFRLGLERRSDIIYNRRQAQKLYDLIVRPFAHELESLQVKTLVFVPDSFLRSVPMAALHDGQNFLIEKYAIASTPSLTLTDPSKIKSENLRALAVGLTQDAKVDGRIYKALTNVKKEIDQVLMIIPGSKQLLNQNFTRAHLQAELQRSIYPIIHIATHAEFGIAPEDTFLIIGKNEKLTMTDLYRMIQDVSQGINSVDLLLLTACETARGNDHTNLGLASVAVSAGVKSTLASLWSINDAATVTLVTKFYQYWYDYGLSKAEALQKAQQDLITLGKKYAHPYYWAPFILLGNWL
ncbi:CHAT domain-containing protein [Fischerella sp. JS2]|uniref:CHAT domain-containing protein n=1 Tax=Fischerella sp. JS2 TaxID=2597771 RepID=UPI0028EF8F50|nr:CHAT domain-containing protein [Fischerella sp. JS2]